MTEIKAEGTARGVSKRATVAGTAEFCLRGDILPFSFTWTLYLNGEALTNTFEINYDMSKSSIKKSSVKEKNGSFETKVKFFELTVLQGVCRNRKPWFYWSRCRRCLKRRGWFKLAFLDNTRS
jgi:hypothetical protein